MRKLTKQISITKIFTLAFIFLSTLFFAQKYILLDDLKKDFTVKEFTLHTKDLYTIDEKIVLYNVFMDKETLLLLSVLPSFDNRDQYKIPISSRIKDWKKVDYDNIKEKIITSGKLRMNVFEWSLNNTPDKKTFEYKLVKRIGSDYYVAKNTFAEVFSLQKFDYPLSSSYGNINIKENKVSIKEVRDAYLKQFPNENFPMDFQNVGRNTGILFAKKYYLSKEYLLKGKKAYQFWTFDGWWEMDGANQYKGIDRFVYIENEGIVGGSFDFYFGHWRKFGSYQGETEMNLWRNIINENVMIAQELK